MTYHGPGQLVGYLVIDLAARGAADVHRFLRGIEADLVAALATLGVGGAQRCPGRTGVFAAAAGRPRKLASIGVGLRGWVSFHGFALNVTLDPADFAPIVPCGLADIEMSSLARELGAGAPRGPDGADPRGRGRGLRGALGCAVSEPARGPAGEKPPWLRVRVRMTPAFEAVQRTVREHRLHTVCASAACPNLGECWARGTATFMIGGNLCTRRCGFCDVPTGRPAPLDADEPERVAQAVEQLGLAFAVITCVARDDLPDGGAGQMAADRARDPPALPGHRDRGADRRLQGQRGGAAQRARGRAGRAEPQPRDGRAAHAQGQDLRRATTARSRS